MIAQALARKALYATAINLVVIARMLPVSAAPFTSKGRPAVQVIALDITQRKKAEAALLANRRQLKAVSKRVVEVRQAERQRVAVELHDELGQALTAIKINLYSRELLQGKSPADLNAENLRIVEESLQQVRRMPLALRPSVLDDLGLAPALRWLVDQSVEYNGFGSIGVLDMHERATLIGGELSIRTALGAGTTLRLTFVLGTSRESA